MSPDEEPGQSVGGEEVAPGLRVPPSAIRITFVRSPGPGGQNVNRRATKCRLAIGVDALALTLRQRRRLEDLAGSRITDDGELTITSSEHRSQERNRRACFERLRALIIEAKRPVKPRRPTRPTRGSRERRLEGKRRRADIKKKRRPPEH